MQEVPLKANWQVGSSSASRTCINLEFLLRKESYVPWANSGGVSLCSIIVVVVGWKAQPQNHYAVTITEESLPGICCSDYRFRSVQTWTRSDAFDTWGQKIYEPEPELVFMFGQLSGQWSLNRTSVQFSVSTAFIKCPFGIWIGSKPNIFITTSKSS